ncbi:AAA family ATPase [Actinoplanes sp. TBRC 11911]|uniref:AAA family ATPase n=1 Tax=Actinoplanes sp. TBRC 11911 TaxID=2729386 RepID=UPI00145F025B|nr:AAA family ATPase [Actinoplanes sp. TBRC 11911]NMO53999.1 AAA family ATPase [Actinoplanes sp. TBRC 11911]
MRVNDLVGRDGLLADLLGWFRPAARGSGRAALLLGEAGAGKSSLADAVAAGLDGFRVARGWCSAAGMPPYWPWRSALAKVAPGLPFDSGDASRDDRQVLFTAVLDALERQPAPLLIVLEDLHWADASSLALLRSVAAAPVALLCTRRDEPGVNPLADPLADLPTSVRRIAVPPLDDVAAATLVSRIVGDRLPGASVAAVVARAGGNPFFLAEVARLLAAHGSSAMAVVPPGVHEVLGRRVARLTQSCATLLAAAAVTAETATAGPDLIDERLVVAVTGRSPETVTDLLDEAVRAGLVTAGPSPRFAHALVREVLVADLPRGEAGRTHRRTAELIEPSGDAERLAYHWSRSSGPDAPGRAAAWSIRAAEQAVDALGFDQAVAHLRRALDGAAADRVDVLIRLGRAQRLAGDPVGSRASFEAAAALAGESGRADDLAVAALGIGGGVIGFEVPIADEAYAEMLRDALARQTGDSPVKAALLGRLSMALTGLAGPGERRRLAQEAVAMAERTGDPATTAGVLAAYCDAVAGPEHVTARLAAADRMLAVAAGRESRLLARRLRLLAYFERGDLARVDAEIAAYRRDAGAAGIPLYQWLPEIWRGARALLTGDPDAALAHAATAEAIGARAGSGNAVLLGLALRMHAHLTAGRAAELAGEMRALLDQVAVVPLQIFYRAAPAVVLLAAGDDTEARATLNAYVETAAADIAPDAEWLEGHWALAEIAVRLGDERAAARVLSDLRPFERLWAVDGIGAAVFGTVGHQLGRLCALLGRHREAHGYFERALADYEHAGARLLAGQVRAEAGLPRPAPVRDEGVLRRDGRYWHVEWRGTASVVADGKGIRDLAVLLARPHRPVPAVELAGVESAGDLGPRLDATARAAYRARLATLDAALADGTGDARILAEREAIVAELRAAIGLGGRPRAEGDPADRARKAVTMRIRAAITAVERTDPALARHLRNAIKTGRVCAYQPETAVRWRT